MFTGEIILALVDDGTVASADAIGQRERVVFDLLAHFSFEKRGWFSHVLHLKHRYISNDLPRRLMLIYSIDIQ